MWRGVGPKAALCRVFLPAFALRGQEGEAETGGTTKRGDGDISTSSWDRRRG